MSGTESAEAREVENYEQLWADAAKAAAENGHVVTQPEETETETPVEVKPEGEAEEEAVAGGETTAEETAPEAEPEPVIRAGKAGHYDARTYVKRERQRMQKQFEDAANELAERAKTGLELERLARLKDYDGIAKVLGMKGFGEMAMDQIETAAAPERREVAAVREDIRQMREEQAREREALNRERAERETQRQVEQHMNDVRTTVSKMPTVPADLAKDPEFVEGVVLIQQEFWDPDKKTTISIQQAAQIALDNLAKQHARLQSIFTGSKPAETAQARGQTDQTGAAEQKRKVPTAISQRQVADAEPELGETIDDFESEKDWFKNWEAKLKRGRSAR